MKMGNKNNHIALLGVSKSSLYLGRTPLVFHPIRSLEQLFLLRPIPAIVVLGSEAGSKQLLGSHINAIRQSLPMTDVLVWMPQATGRFVLDAMKHGAKDVVLQEGKEPIHERLVQILQEQPILQRVEGNRRQRSNKAHFEGIYSRSPKMWDLFDECASIASTDANVMISGETGTGKELFAKAIHKRSGKLGRFVAINCAGLSESLINAELFGYKKGAFTGADRDKIGLYEYAKDGTLFLDEIGNMPEGAQFYLLRALQEKKIRPLGANEEVEVNARIVAATSQDLEGERQKSRFRPDLLFRLDVIRIQIPPLRSRDEDIPYLFSHFMKKYAKQYNMQRPAITDQFLDALLAYAWPGNVRQLENISERLLLTNQGKKLSGASLHKALGRGAAGKAPPPPLDSAMEDQNLDYERPLKDLILPQVRKLETQYFVALLKRYEGRLTRVAEHAGVDRRTLYRKFSELAIDPSIYRRFKRAKKTSF